MIASTASWHQLADCGTDANAQQKLEKYWVERVNSKTAWDPYLVWTSLTSFKYVAPQQPDWVPFLIETSDGAAKLIAEMATVLSHGPVWLSQVIKIPSIYSRSLVAGVDSKPSRYVTALVHKDHFDLVASFKGVVRMQLGLARAGDVDERPVNDSPEINEEASNGYSSSDRPAKRGDSPDFPDSTTPVLGVIDDGCNFAHPAYITESGTRVVRLWDQSVYATKWSGKPAYFGYGQVFAKQDLDGQISISSEKEVYKAVYAPYTLPSGSLAYPSIRLDTATHGTSVMQIFAGRFDPPPQQSALPVVPTDAASKADIIFVQLPRACLDDTASGSMCVYALDALRYIVDRAETYKGSTRVIRPVVINLSYGSMSGPHDGTAPLDEALNELIDRRGNLAVVVAAGNNRKSSCHACVPVAPGAASNIGIQLLPNNPLVSTLEIWIPEGSLGEIQIQLSSPSTAKSGWISIGEIHKLKAANSTQSVAYVVAPKRTALGKNGTMFLVAFSPTARRTIDEPSAESGVWKLSLQNTGSNEVSANIWVERNDMAYAAQRRQQAFLVDWDVAGYVTSTDTICSPASAKNAIAVSSHVWSTGQRSKSSAEGGGLGKTDLDASAPADVGDEIRGIRVEGVLPGSSTRTSGTSMAAPMVARGIVEWMETNNPTSVAAVKVRAFSAFPVPVKLKP